MIRLIAALTGIAAALGAGYAAAGITGLVDAAAVTSVGVLLIARALVRKRQTRSVRPENPRHQTPALRTADFPAYRTLASDVEWAQLSRRHYEHVLRPRLVRLGATLGHRVNPADLALAGSAADDIDGPGVDRATLERIITILEGA